MTKLIVFGEDWGAHPSSTQHLIKNLQSRYEIIWVNSIGLRRPRLSLSDIKRLFRKGTRIFRQFAVQEPVIGTPFPVINVPAIPWPGSLAARKMNGVLIRKSLESYLDDTDRPILWLSLPSAVDIIGKLDEKAILYYCGDDFSSLAGVDHAAVSEMEKELAEKADLIVVVSDVLAEKFPPEKTHIVLHGVDYDLFSNPRPRPRDMPSSRPIAGYYGSLAEWIDQDLICETADRLPDWDFVIIGTTSVDFSKLADHSNIYLLGPRAHDELPGYIQHWNAAMLPFRQTPQIHACNPLKLREYLASGTPVVTTYFPALKGYEDLVSVGTSTEDFIRAIEDTRILKGRHEIGQRRVANETWSKRANEVDALLETLSASK